MDCGKQLKRLQYKLLRFKNCTSHSGTKILVLYFTLHFFLFDTYYPQHNTSNVKANRLGFNSVTF